MILSFGKKNGVVCQAYVISSHRCFLKLNTPMDVYRLWGLGFVTLGDGILLGIPSYRVKKKRFSCRSPSYVGPSLPKEGGSGSVPMDCTCSWCFHNEIHVFSIDFLSELSVNWPAVGASVQRSLVK
jgi:hypothetical protein